MNEPKTQKSKLTIKSKKIRIERMITLGIIKDRRIKDKLKEVDKKCPYHLPIMVEGALWTLNTLVLKQMMNMKQASAMKINLNNLAKEPSLLWLLTKLQ